jgi:hypothetical protein
MRENPDKVVHEFSEVASGEYPGLQVRRRGRTRRVNKGVVLMNWRRRI